MAGVASAQELQALTNPLVIDCRDPNEVEAGKGGPPQKIDGSINVPLNVNGQAQSVHLTSVEEFAEKLTAAGIFPIADKSKAIITHCGSGGRGGKAAKLLLDMGFANTKNGGSPAKIAEALTSAQSQVVAGDAGIVTSSTWANIDADGASTEGPGQRAIAELGRPVHINCCPTGTVEFMGEKCCDGVDPVVATVQALSSKMSTHKPKFLIIYGSLRKESYSRKLAVEVGRILAGYGADVKLFDPEGLPLFCRDGDANQHGKVKELRSLTRWCEGMVWVSPEIHGNYSGVFKNQVDWMPLTEGSIRPTQGKTLAVLQVEGGSQSFNTVNNMRTLGRWMRCVVIPNQSSVPEAYKEFQEDGVMKNSSYRSRVVDVAEELFKYTLLLRDQQPYLLDRYSEHK